MGTADGAPRGIHRERQHSRALHCLPAPCSSWINAAQVRCLGFVFPQRQRSSCGACRWALSSLRPAPTRCDHSGGRLVGVTGGGKRRRQARLQRCRHRLQAWGRRCACCGITRRGPKQSIFGLQLSSGASASQTSQTCSAPPSSSPTPSSAPSLPRVSSGRASAPRSRRSTTTCWRSTPSWRSQASTSCSARCATTWRSASERRGQEGRESLRQAPPHACGGPAGAALCAGGDGPDGLAAADRSALGYAQLPACNCLCDLAFAKALLPPPQAGPCQLALFTHVWPCFFVVSCCF